MDILLFDVVKIVFSLGLLSYASWSDFKTREVSNKVWVFYAPVALLLSLTQLILYNFSQLPLYGLSFGVTAGISLLLFYSGVFGGADSKALMCIALALPFAPVTLFESIIAQSISPISEIIFPITILSNGVLFAAASGIYMVLRNFVWHKKSKQIMFPGSLSQESFGKKMLVLITGYKMDIAKVKAKWHLFPMEDIVDSANTTRKLVIIPQDEGREKIVERLSESVQAKKIDRYIWATPGLPMLIFITLGLVVALVFGDVIWSLIRLVLGS